MTALVSELAWFRKATLERTVAMLDASVAESMLLTALENADTL
jgi:hypothetical protein